MGVFDHRAAGSGMPGAPHVKVRGFSLWGSVGIRRKHRAARTELSHVER